MGVPVFEYQGSKPGPVIDFIARLTDQRFIFRVPLIKT